MSGNYTNTNGRSDSLNQGAAHDSGLYDPNRHDNQIVAVYDTNAQAMAARDALTAAGIPASAIQVVDRGGEGDNMGSTVGRPVGSTGTVSTAEDRDQGFWGAIKSLFAPEEDVTAYHHAVDRGHAMVVVRPNANMDRSRAIQVLESTDPIDFDAKLAEWRQAGYDYSTRPDASASGSMSAGSMGAGDMGAGGYQAGTAMGAMGMGAGGMGAGAVGAAGAGSAATLGSTDRTVQTTMPQAGTAQATTTQPTSQPTQPTTTATGARAGTAMTADRTGTGSVENADTIKVVEERLRVGKREVAAGAVRVRSYVVERPVEEQVRLHEERISIERRPVDRAAAPGETGAFQDRTIEARATSEEAVVSKTARVVEEIGIHKDVTDRTETVRDTVRRTEVDVDDTTAAGRTTGGVTGSTGTASATTPSATPGATSSGINTPRK